MVVVSDNKVAKDILLHQAKSFSKGLLSEILDFVMGQDNPGQRRGVEDS